MISTFCHKDSVLELYPYWDSDMTDFREPDVMGLSEMA